MWSHHAVCSSSTFGFLSVFRETSVWRRRDRWQRITSASFLRCAARGGCIHPSAICRFLSGYVNRLVFVREHGLMSKIMSTTHLNGRPSGPCTAENLPTLRTRSELAHLCPYVRKYLSTEIKFPLRRVTRSWFRSCSCYGKMRTTSTPSHIWHKKGETTCRFVSMMCFKLSCWASQRGISTLVANCLEDTKRCGQKTITNKETPNLTCY